MNKLKNLLLTLSVLLLCSLFLDRVLKTAGFPAHFPVAHLPNHQERIKQLEMEYDFATNSQGLRYREIPLKKPIGNRRIFVVGDSFTEGAGVEANEIFTTLLEKSFTDTESDINFINAGLRGAGPLQYARIFLHLGLKYQPDGLLICLYANDVTDMPEYLTPKDFKLRPRLLTRREKLLYNLYPRMVVMWKKFQRSRHQSRANPEFVELVSEHALSIGKSPEAIATWKASLPANLVMAVQKGEFTGAYLSYGLLKPHYWSDALDIDTPRAERKWHSLAITLEKITSIAKQQGIEAAIVYLPAVFQYNVDAYRSTNPRIATGMIYRQHWLTEQTEAQKRLAAWCRQRRVPFLDLTATFRQAAIKNKQLNWDLDIHWRPAGHRVAATEIERWIKEQRVFRFLDTGF